MMKRDWLIWDIRTTVGNCILWWGPERKGYVCDIDDAGCYSKEEALAQAASRSTDVAVPREVAERFAVTHVRRDTGIQNALTIYNNTGKTVTERDVLLAELAHARNCMDRVCGRCMRPFVQEGKAWDGQAT